MWLIVGLGNPEAEYALNRHNVGFMALDTYARTMGVAARDFREKFNGVMARKKRDDGTEVILFKPLTYMNLSGDAVLPAMTFFKIPLQRVIVIHDDLDLAFGTVRVKTGGGNGGHNGLKSIDARVGTDYHRVRIGIGHPGRKEMVSGYVLGDFSGAEQDGLAAVLEKIPATLNTLMKK